MNCPWLITKKQLNLFRVLFLSVTQEPGSTLSFHEFSQKAKNFAFVLTVHDLSRENTKNCLGLTPNCALTPRIKVFHAKSMQRQYNFVLEGGVLGDFKADQPFEASDLCKEFYGFFALSSLLCPSFNWLN